MAEVAAFEPFADEADAGESLKEPNELLIGLVAGCGLAIRDRNVFSKGGSSDPRVVFAAADAPEVTRESTVRKKTLDPVWHEVLALPLSRSADGSAKVRLRCEDHDDLSAADSMGIVEIDVAGARQRTRKWYDLNPDPAHPKAEVSGALEVVLLWRYSAELDFDPFLGAEPTGLPLNELHVAVCRGRRLVAMDKPLFGKGPGTSDPRVTLTIFGADARAVTAVRRKTLNPVWNETFSIAVEEPRGGDAAVLRVRCEDWNEFSAAAAMGSFDLPLAADDLRNRKRAWFALEAGAEAKAACGELELVLWWTHNPAAVFEPFLDDESDAALSPNELLVGLVRGRGLAVMDKKLFGKGPGTSDPRVVLSVAGADVKCVSTAKFKTLAPEWRECFSLHLEATQLEEPVLRLRCEDRDDLSAADSMGIVDVDLSPLADGQRTRRWYALVDDDKSKCASGSLEVVLKWRHNAALAFHPFLEDDLNDGLAPNELLVAVLRGRALMVADKHMFSAGGSSDPRVVLTVSGTDVSAKTTVKYKTLAPIWNEIFALALDEGAEVPVLRLRCEDYDVASAADSMGGAEVPVRRLRHRGWFALLDDGGCPGASGAIEIVTKWRHNSELLYEPFAAEAAAAPPDGAEPNELLVALVRGKHLPIMDKYLFGKGGSSDPRVRFRVLETDMKCASTVKRKTLNPVWRECFAFALEASDGAATLRVECEDHDDLSSADAMGTVDIDIAPARFQRRRQWHKLSVAQTSKKKVDVFAAEAALELVLLWHFNPELVFEPFLDEPRGDDASMPPNELLFALVRGRNLIIADANLFSKGGSSDPHVSFSVRGAEVKVTSTVQKKTLNPVWRETFSIPLDYDSVSDDAQLDVRCEDWDELSSADFMGEVSVPLKGPGKRQARSRAWHALHPAPGAAPAGMGELELVVRWRFNRALRFSPFDAPEPWPARPPNEVRFAVIRGRNLAAKDRDAFTGVRSSDPYVVLCLGAASQKTSVARKTLAPQWNAALAFAVEPGDDDEIVLECFDSDFVGADDLIGRAALGAVTKGLVDRRPHRAWVKLVDVGRSLVASSSGGGHGVDVALGAAGDVEVEMQWWHNPAIEERTALMAGMLDRRREAANELVLLVGRARKLRRNDWFERRASRRGAAPKKAGFLGGLAAALGDVGGALLRRRAGFYVEASFSVDGEVTRVATEVRDAADASQPAWDVRLALRIDEGDVRRGEVAHVDLRVVEVAGNDERVLANCRLDVGHLLEDRRAVAETADAAADAGDAAMAWPKWVWRRLQEPPQSEGGEGGDEDSSDGEFDAELKVGCGWRHDAALEPELFCEPDDYADDEANVLHVAVMRARGVGRRRSADDDDEDARTAGSRPQTPGTPARASTPGDVRRSPAAASRASTAPGGPRTASTTARAVPATLRASAPRSAPTPHAAGGDAGDAGPSAADDALPQIRISVHTSGGAAEKLGGVRTTATAARTRRPRWLRETFVFELPDADELTSDAALEFTIWDQGESAARAEPRRTAFKMFATSEPRGRALGTASIKLAPLLDKERRRRWLSVSPPSAQGASRPGTEDVSALGLAGPPAAPGLAPLAAGAPSATLVRSEFASLGEIVSDEARLAPFGCLEVVVRCGTDAARAARGATPAGLVERACRRFRLEPGDAAAAVSLRRAAVGKRDVLLLAAALDRAVCRAAAPWIAAPTLVKIDLRTCGLDGAGLASLARQLADNDVLTSLDVSGNDFRDGVRLARGAPANAGLAALGAALAGNRGLTSLNLSESRVEARGAAAIADGLRLNAALTDLRLSHNAICDVTPQGWGEFETAGVESVARMLACNQTLERLDLAHNQLCGVTAPWNVGARGRFSARALAALAPALRPPAPRTARPRRRRASTAGLVGGRTRGSARSTSRTTGPSRRARVRSSTTWRGAAAAAAPASSSTSASATASAATASSDDRRKKAARSGPRHRNAAVKVLERPDCTGVAGKRSTRGCAPASFSLVPPQSSSGCR